MTAVADMIRTEPKPRSLAESAFQRLIHMITRLELEPGSLIIEKDLMATLEIGRTPVREALQRLAMEGLVVHLPNRGMFVTNITPENAQHIYEFRAMIDPPMVRLAAERATSDQVSELDDLHNHFLSAKAADDVDAYVQLLRSYYNLLSEAAGNIYLAEVMPRIFNLHLRLWFYIASKRGGWHDVVEAHADMAGAVTAAIRGHDPDKAEAAMKSYIAGRHQDMRDLL